MNKEILERLIFEEKKSYEEIGRMFNCCGNNVKKTAKKLGIVLPIRRCTTNFENFNKNRINKIFLIDEKIFKDAILNSTSYIDIFKKLNLKNHLNNKIRKKIRERCNLLNIKLVLIKKEHTDTREKHEIFDACTRRQTAKNIIRRSSRDVYKKNNGERKCCICGYEKFIEVAHIKPVPEFDDNALISEINSFDNLVALCPNHHMELDNGFIKINKDKNGNITVSNLK